MNFREFLQEAFKLPNIGDEIVHKKFGKGKVTNVTKGKQFKVKYENEFSSWHDKRDIDDFKI